MDTEVAQFLVQPLGADLQHLVFGRKPAYLVGDDPCVAAALFEKLAAQALGVLLGYGVYNSRQFERQLQGMTVPPPTPLPWDGSVPADRLVLVTTRPERLQAIRRDMNRAALQALLAPPAVASRACG